MPDVTRIVLPETFSFKHHQWFRGQCMDALSRSQRVELICDQVKFLDSAALGMIVSFQRKQKEKHNHDIWISNPSSYCDELFTLANLYNKYLHRITT